MDSRESLCQKNRVTSIFGPIGTAVSGSAAKSNFKIADTAAGRKRQIEAANQTKRAKIAALKEDAAAVAAAAASAAAAISTDAASPTPAAATRSTQRRAAADAASSAATSTDSLNHPVKRRSPRSPKKQETSATAVLPPGANVSVEAVPAVQSPAFAEASASVQGVASVPAASLVSISFFIRFNLSEFTYTNSYLLHSVYIPFIIYQLVWYSGGQGVFGWRRQGEGGG